MNDKEKELWRIIDNVIKCCAITTLVRHLEKLAFNYLKTSRVYRLATAQATLLNKDVEPMCI